MVNLELRLTFPLLFDNKYALGLRTKVFNLSRNLEWLKL